MLSTVLAASLVALGACDNADATLPETEAVPAEFRLSAEDLRLSAEELALLCSDTTDVVEEEEEPPVQAPGAIGGDPGQWSPGNPNEPAGFTRWAEHDFTELPNGALSHAGLATTSYGGNYQIVDDATASEGKALRIRYGKGHRDGTSPGRFFVFDKGGSSASTALREWYISLWVMLEEHPEGGWEAPPNELKLWYSGFGRRGRGNGGGAVSFSHGGPVNTIATGFRSRANARASATSVITVQQDNRGAGRHIFPGRWHHVEFHGTLSTPGQSNGTYRMWVDGVLVNEQTAVQNQHPDDWKNGFFEFHWSPVWGGKCSSGCPKKRDDFMRLGHLYISGIRQ